MDKEMEQFQADLLASVRQMKSGKPSRVVQVDVSRIVAARTATGLSQAQFAGVLGVSVRTLQEWEQGRRKPSRAAQSLIRVAEKAPLVLRDIAH